MTTESPEDIDLDFEGDAEVTPQSSYVVEDLTRAVEQYQQLTGQLEFLETRVKEFKQKLTQLEERTIPDIMQGLKLESFTMTTGHAIEIEDVLSVSLSQSTTKPRAIEWLKRTERTSLLSHTIEMVFKRGDEEQLQRALAVLREAEFFVTPTEDVHTGTFKSLLRELIAEGKATEIPEDIGMYRAKKAKIIDPLVKKGKKK